MMMTPGLRKGMLTMHVIASVGWFGAVAGFLGLAIAGLTSQDERVVQAAYLAMDILGWFVIVPFCFASLFTGLVQSFGTSWGLFRHYWVLAKLLITVISTIILMTHMNAISYMADVAAEFSLSSTDFSRLRFQLIVSSGAALVALLITTLLSIYKPRGLTPYGQRKYREQRTISPS